MGHFSGGSRKIIIRKEWNKPLLKFFYEKLKCKLIYLGMPGPNAEDILEWIDYLEHVIAFQCRDYPNPSSPVQDRKYVKQLEAKLLELERQEKLASMVVYDGYIEEVIAQGEDNIRSRFSQNHFITIYNLDFCNQITSPIQIINYDTNEVKEVYKLHTLRELLNFQSKQKMNSKRFVMFLTIHSGFRDEEADNFATSTDSSSIIEYHKKLKSLDRMNKKIRLLKSYVFDSLRNYFCDFSFVPEFLPVIDYKDKMEWLLHFTIIGIPVKSTGRVNCLQNPNEFLEQRFITIKNRKFDFLKTDNIIEKEFDINSVELFKSSEAFKTYWK